MCAACRPHRFFNVVGHGIDEALGQRRETRSHRFFALPETVKSHYALALGGRAWRGWLPPGGELTSGRPDWREGLYLGTDLPDQHSRVRARVPLLGRNLIPGDEVLPEFAINISRCMEGVMTLGHRVIAKVRAGVNARHGVGEHTDYGLSTLLRQDDVGGLQVRTPAGWIKAPPEARRFVCNIGDMIERITGGFYKSTPHRVRLNTAGRDHPWFTLLFDPAFEFRRAAHVAAQAFELHASSGLDVQPRVQ